MLLDGHKFAVRVYVLVVRVRPLLVLLHSASYVKVCGLEYDASRFSQAELFRHVTNQEFQKKGDQAYENWKVLPVLMLSELDARIPPQGMEPWSVCFWRQVRR